MTASLIFLLCLLVLWIGLNRKLLASRFGWRVRACEWSRIPTRDREGEKAWFCPSCGREALVEGSARPPDCGATFGGR